MKKISSFLKKLKETTFITKVINNKVYKYWISIKVEKDIKSLDWWKTYSTKYSNLLKLTVDYLCIQVSLILYKQLFLTAD